MAEEAILLKEVAMEPNDCPLGSALTIKMTFTTGKAVAKAVWDLKYMVDMASKRKLIALGQTAETCYEAGKEYSMEVSTPGIETAGFKPHQLANAGLVVVTLLDGEEEVVAVNLVTQVTKRDDELIRTIYSPLEE
eukprot:CAMPEP_0179443746 /NCGR_PEP_ID=MMETSP0799-20121207/27208_1 /TAXON_ID=46947 /ORGANISM="Geminigera cryophila, Strain CCMP2564" /LENGTH=134 /DNA_ID=CAMNT_0021230129 /DNA_START=8 /DNA_END=412 /DNA_ORIENTATION=-